MSNIDNEIKTLALLPVPGDDRAHEALILAQDYFV